MIRLLNCLWLWRIGPERARAIEDVLKRKIDNSAGLPPGSIVKISNNERRMLQLFPWRFTR